jgi:cytochrome P450
LAIKQEIQQKLRDELDSKLKGEKANYKNIQQLDYLMYCIKENMRLYSPVERVPDKIMTKDVELDGYHIPKGTRVGINISAIHQSKKVYGDPENFRPERWSNEEQEKIKIPSSAWIPFSYGSRVCIGNNFSLIEQKLFVCELLQRFKITLVNEKDEIKTAPFKTIRGPLNIHIKLTPVK